MTLFLQFRPETFVKRFTLDMNSWTLAESRDLMDDLPQNLEFSNINFNYQARKYKYAYMAKNAYALNAAAIKVIIILYCNFIL